MATLPPAEGGTTPSRDEDDPSEHRGDQYSPSEPQVLPQSQRPVWAPPSREHWGYLSDRRRRTWTQRPEPGSLYAEILKTPSETPMIPPICWTEQHVDILGVNWHRLPDQNEPSPAPIGSHEFIRDYYPNTCAPGLTGHALFRNLRDMLLFDPIDESRRRVKERKGIKAVLAALWPAVFPECGSGHFDIIIDGYVSTFCVHAQLLFPMMTACNQRPKSKATSQQPPSTPQETTATPQTVNPRELMMNPQESIVTPLEPTATPQQPMVTPQKPGAVSAAPAPKKISRSRFWKSKAAVCYVSRNELHWMRSQGFALKRNHAVQARRTIEMVKGQQDQDPMLAGLFLAMAQRHFYASPVTGKHGRTYPYRTWNKTTTDPALGDVKLRIVTHEIEKQNSYASDASHFVVYTATVKAGFLQRLHDPFASGLGTDGKSRGLDIEYTHVPIWPVLGLRERLGIALGQDLVGPFIPAIFKTYMRGNWFKQDMQMKAEMVFARNLNVITLSSPGPSYGGPVRSPHPLASSSIGERDAYIETRFQMHLAHLATLPTRPDLLWRYDPASGEVVDTTWDPAAKPEEESKSEKRKRKSDEHTRHGISFRRWFRRSGSS